MTNEAVELMSKLTTKISECRLCELYHSRLCTVVGRGYTQADFMFVGEAPGREENKKGQPFVGASGAVLDKWIAELNMEDNFYITNIVKCHPPNNRKPTAQEIVTCIYYLLAEVRIVKPKVIVVLGRVAEHGLTRYACGESLSGATVMFQYHPAYYLYRHTDWSDDIAQLDEKVSEIYDEVGEVYE